MDRKFICLKNRKMLSFDIQNIINQMQEFQKEFDGEFKDGKTFWKHYYKRLDEVIAQELHKLVNSSDDDDFGIVVNRGDIEEENIDPEFTPEEIAENLLRFLNILKIKIKNKSTK